jgi:hypothetical protein
MQVHAEEPGADLKLAKLEVRCRHGQLEKALQSRLPVTQQMMKGFATLASQGGLRSTPGDELKARYQQMQTEVGHRSFTA